MNEIEELKQQIQKFHEMADKRGEFLLLGELGNRYFAEGNLNEAEQTYKKSLSLAKEIGDQLGQSSTYSNLGNIYSERKDYDTANAYYKQALDLAEAIGHLRLVGNIMNNLGLIAYKTGNINEAKKRWEKALDIAKQLQDLKLENEVLNNQSLLASSPHEEASQATKIPTQKQWQLRRSIRIGIAVFISISVIALGVIWLLNIGLTGSKSWFWLAYFIPATFTTLAALLTALQWLFPFASITKGSEKESEIESIRLRMTDGAEHTFEEWITNPDRLKHFIDVFNQPSSTIKPQQVIFVMKNGSTIRVDVSEDAQNNPQLNELLSYLKVGAEQK